jgi:hypothetical protein
MIQGLLHRVRIMAGKTSQPKRAEAPQRLR